MIPLLVDQNFNEHIVDGLTRQVADFDAVLARHVALATQCLMPKECTNLVTFFPL